MSTVAEEVAKGMAGAEHLASEERKAEMLEAVKAVAPEKRYFIVDAVWEKLGGVGDGKRDNGSGLGPAMRRAQEQGFIVSTGDFRRSERGPTRGRPVTIWRAT